MVLVLLCYLFELDLVWISYYFGMACVWLRHGLGLAWFWSRFWFGFELFCHMSFAAVPEASGRHAEGSRKRAPAANATHGNKVNAPYIYIYIYMYIIIIIG